jgi:8-amino-7-oxononanoate synthase
MRLSRVKPQVFEHLDLDELERGLKGAAAAPARWVVVEAYYSMDGDGPDLIRLRAGAGPCHLAGVRADVLMAAFGKAVGSHGACVLGSSDVRTWLWNRARSFVFSTAPSPVHAATLASQIHTTRAAHSARNRLQLLAKQVRQTLLDRGVPIVGGSFGPVLSLLCGSEAAALGLAERLRASGVLAQAIRPPTVPDDGSRVRLILSASLSEAQEERLIEIVSRETSLKESHA